MSDSNFQNSGTPSFGISFNWPGRNMSTPKSAKRSPPKFRPSWRMENTTMHAGKRSGLSVNDGLASISKDRHWSVVYDPKGAADSVDPEAEADQDRMTRHLEMVRKANYGFERVERLKGNIGYIDLRRFDPASMAERPQWRP